MRDFSSLYARSHDDPHLNLLESGWVVGMMEQGTVGNSSSQVQKKEDNETYIKGIAELFVRNRGKCIGNGREAKEFAEMTKESMLLRITCRQRSWQPRWQRYRR